MSKLVSAFLIGALFGLGIAIAGMINPAKVFNFFDIAGSWDPSLAFVMGGGLTVAFIGYRLIFARRSAPALEAEFATPARTHIDAELIGGAAIFGVGWGIAGYCPGPALTALSTLSTEAFVFVAATVAGGLLAKIWPSQSAAGSLAQR
jgi:uncharacterized membrane protein YedE/YeeE